MRLSMCGTRMRSRAEAGRAASALALFLLLAGAAHAHDARPIFVQLHETEPLQFALTASLPPPLAPHRLRLALGPDCAPQASAASWRCRTDPQLLRLRLPSGAAALPILLRLRWRDGTSETRVFAPGESELALPAREEALAVFASYLSLGVRHMLTGWDHLCIVLLLLWLARRAWPLLGAITGFTLGHSVTLALGALSLITLPLAYVECLIALSVVWLAAQMRRAPHAAPPARRLMPLAAAIGLLHGLGFASVLRALGLPQTEVPMALFGFNLGVEVGQLIFLAGWLALAAAAARLAAMRPQLRLMRARMRPLMLLAIGSIAAYWTLARGADLLFA